MKERGFYTNTPDNIHSYNKAEFAKSYGAILERLDLSPESKVLEFGAGKGAEAQHIREVFGAKVVETDATREAYKANPSPERGFVTAEYWRLPYADNSFTFIHCKDVLIHIQEKDKLLAEFRRVLVPGGTILLTTELAEGVTQDVEVLSKRVAPFVSFPATEKNYFYTTKRVFDNILERIGFKYKQKFEWTPSVQEKNWYDKERVVVLLESTKK